MNTDHNLTDSGQQTTEDDLPATGLQRMGTLGLIFGAVITALAFMDSTSGIPFRMPRSWYVNRAIWYFLGLLGFVLGCLLLKHRPQDSEESDASDGGSPFRTLVFYTRQGCHLCDDARKILLRYDTQLPIREEVDIDDDPQLVEKFGDCVPVVEIDGKVRFRGRVNEMLLKRLIEASA